MSDNGNGSGLKKEHFALFAVFVLAASIALGWIFSIINKDSSSIRDLLFHLALTVATTITLFISFDRIKKFKSQGWLIAYIIAVVIVVVFLALEFVKIFQSF
ncbi:MAG: hypothetical protein LBU60_00295 [Clostridiales bacterium]|jgi:hypothetical protein|nr:hypothetical protein [Clostridiales bacterium]